MALGLFQQCGRWLFVVALVVVQTLFFIWFLWAAFNIRMYSVKDYGYIIHEFDPWFNFRATEYLAENGASKFFKWYDYKSWYPIGRPIGTTIYPGMQFTAVWLWQSLQWVPATTFDVPLPKSIYQWYKPFKLRMQKRGWIHLPPLPKSPEFGPMSLNDICVLIPAWFGSVASALCGLLTYEVSRSVNAALVATGIMAIIPGHLMRSMAGEFDNEAVAMSIICSTFWLWLRSVRTPSSWPVGLLAGLSYYYMVATWGGYIFVLNLIGVHALVLVGLGRFNSGVYKAYTIFYVLGTFLAMQVPVVGWTPLRSLEQMGPLGVFLGYQVLAVCDARRRSRNLSVWQFVRFRIAAFMALGVGLVVVVAVLMPMGYFGPLSSRIRALFVEHTKTGNPLVDSVAEHQPASDAAYQHYLHMPLQYCFMGSLVCLFNRNNACYFVALYGLVAMHFSGKMSRLVLICAPITSVMAGVWFGFAIDLLVETTLLLLGKEGPKMVTDGTKSTATTATEQSGGNKDAKGSKKSSKKAEDDGKSKRAKKNDSRSLADWPLEEYEEERRPGGIAQAKLMSKSFVLGLFPESAQQARRKCVQRYHDPIFRLALWLLLIFYLFFMSSFPQSVKGFLEYCDSNARSMSNAMVKFKAQGGRIIDDHWVGYKWIDKNTPEDARIMAWWDYGYQITGIARRTSLADGNTWNHEQIATLGKLLSSSQKKSHNALRHLADYVLVWTGGTQDDLSISTHFARIGNSVFPEHCGDQDPFCTQYGFHGNDRNQPTPMMKKSLVFNLYMHEKKAGVGVGADPKLFELVYKTKYDLMRLYRVLNVSQESKKWVADPKNRICDAPGSWYCVGQYPPALKKLISARRSFSQVEDFNKKGEKTAYTRMIEKNRHMKEL
mmetsp:Transcript_90373/g.173952  ORF Transcript_90373/g.173952 Transcript_90373/m.173952 type:complete len:886 (+) Transcript_90373:46-2703(+)